MLDTPIAIIIFNRPDATELLLKKISAARPKRLFVISDGARVGIDGERERVSRCRELVEKIQWECDVYKNYSDVNLGCKERVSTGLDWLFSMVDMAIILEDDCIPHLDFFRFSSELLDRYKDDERVMSVCGTRICPEDDEETSSYYFSKYSICWGWATWKRAWACFDSNLELLDHVDNKDFLYGHLGGRRQAIYWKYVLSKTRSGAINSWAYRWMFSCWINNGLAVVPKRNLISNVGFGHDASRTKSEKRYTRMAVSGLDFPLSHQKVVSCDYENDRFIEDLMYSKSVRNRIWWAADLVAASLRNTLKDQTMSCKKGGDA